MTGDLAAIPLLLQLLLPLVGAMMTGGQARGSRLQLMLLPLVGAMMTRPHLLA